MAAGGLWLGKCLAVLELKIHTPPAELGEKTTGARLRLYGLWVGWRAQVRLVRVVKHCQRLGRFILCTRL